MKPQILVHPITEHIAAAECIHGSNENKLKLINDIASLENPILVFGQSEDKQKSLFRREARIVYDKFPSSKYARNGVNLLQKLVPEGSEIELGGFLHGACICAYATLLARHFQVTILEHLTDAAIAHIHDTSNGLTYENLMRLGVQFVPEPVKERFYEARTYKGNKLLSISTFQKGEVSPEQFKADMKKIHPEAEVKIEDRIFYASSL